MPIVYMLESQTERSEENSDTHHRRSFTPQLIQTSVQKRSVCQSRVQSHVNINSKSVSDNKSISVSSDVLVLRHVVYQNSQPLLTEAADRPLQHSAHSDHWQQALATQQLLALQAEVQQQQKGCTDQHHRSEPLPQLFLVAVLLPASVPLPLLLLPLLWLLQTVMAVRLMVLQTVVAVSLHPNLALLQIVAAALLLPVVTALLQMTVAPLPPVQLLLRVAAPLLLLLQAMAVLQAAQAQVLPTQPQRGQHWAEGWLLVCCCGALVCGATGWYCWEEGVECLSVVWVWVCCRGSLAAGAAAAYEGRAQTDKIVSD